MVERSRPLVYDRRYNSQTEPAPFADARVMAGLPVGGEALHEEVHGQFVL